MSSVCAIPRGTNRPVIQVDRPPDTTSQGEREQNLELKHLISEQYTRTPFYDPARITYALRALGQEVNIMGVTSKYVMKNKVAYQCIGILLFAVIIITLYSNNKHDVCGHQKRFFRTHDCNRRRLHFELLNVIVAKKAYSEKGQGVPNVEDLVNCGLYDSVSEINVSIVCRNNTCYYIGKYDNELYEILSEDHGSYIIVERGQIVGRMCEDEQIERQLRNFVSEFQEQSGSLPDRAVSGTVAILFGMEFAG